MSLGSGMETPAKSLFIVEQTQRGKGLTYMLVQRVLPSIPPALTVLVGAKLYEMGKYDVAVFIGFFGLLISLLLLVFLKDTKRQRAQNSFNFNLLLSLDLCASMEELPNRCLELPKKVKIFHNTSLLVLP